MTLGDNTALLWRQIPRIIKTGLGIVEEMLGEKTRHKGTCHRNKGEAELSQGRVWGDPSLGKHRLLAHNTVNTPKKERNTRFLWVPRVEMDKKDRSTHNKVRQTYCFHSNQWDSSAVRRISVEMKFFSRSVKHVKCQWVFKNWHPSLSGTPE